MPRPRFPPKERTKSLSLGKHLPRYSHPGARQTQQCQTNPEKQLLNWLTGAHRSGLGGARAAGALMHGGVLQPLDRAARSAAAG